LITFFRELTWSVPFSFLETIFIINDLCMVNNDNVDTLLKILSTRYRSEYEACKGLLKKSTDNLDFQKVENQLESLTMLKMKIDILNSFSANGDRKLLLD
jgi:hypothetical protein